MLSLHLISRMYVFAHFCTHLFTHIEITDFRAYLCTYFYVLNVLTYLLTFLSIFTHLVLHTYRITVGAWVTLVRNAYQRSTQL